MLLYSVDGSSLSAAVEATHIMMFARAIGDTNQVYYDEEAARKTEAPGIIAPPTFPQAVAQFNPDYRMRPKLTNRGSGPARPRAAAKAIPPHRAACMPSRNTPITGRCAPATCSQWRSGKARSGRRRASAREN